MSSIRLRQSRRSPICVSQAGDSDIQTQLHLFQEPNLRPEGDGQVKNASNENQVPDHVPILEVSPGLANGEEISILVRNSSVFSDAGEFLLAEMKNGPPTRRIGSWPRFRPRWDHRVGKEGDGAG